MSFALVLSMAQFLAIAVPVLADNPIDVYFEPSDSSSSYGDSTIVSVMVNNTDSIVYRAQVVFTYDAAIAGMVDCDFSNSAFDGAFGNTYDFSTPGEVTINVSSYNSVKITNAPNKICDLTIEGVASSGGITALDFDETQCNLDPEQWGGGSVPADWIDGTFECVAPYSLEMIGDSTLDVSQAEFEAMAAATPSNEYVDGSGNTWKGVALWRLIALIDDGDPTTFNYDLTSEYSIVLSALDGYQRTLDPEDFASAFPFIDSEDIFVANKVKLDGTTEWIDLEVDYYPLRVNGAGCTSGSQRVGMLEYIELLNLPELPPASVGVSPSSQAVANGADFDIDVDIDTETASRGWGLNVDFDADKMSANSVTEGTFLSDYATANGGGTIPAGAVSIDNTTGHITIPGYAITGAGTDGPTGIGTLCSVSFTAKADVDDYASIDLSNVVISDVTGTTIPDVAVNGGTVAIGSVPLPDLVVSSASTTADSVDPNMYTITYTIENIGQADADASTTSIVIDGGTPITIACPALAVGAGDTQTTSTQTLSGTADSILITADSASVIAESNEANNSGSTSYSHVDDQPGDVIYGGTTQMFLELELPDPANWAPLDIGENSADRQMTVTSNTNWQVTVSGSNDGFMTKYDGTNYDPSVQLHDAFCLNSEYNVILSGSAQILADGTPAEQPLDNLGDVRDVTVMQQVYYIDPVLLSGCNYQVIVTFTASPTI